MADTQHHRLPGWVAAWLYATSAICTWDASFIVLRPHTLPGGKYHMFWYPYKYYITLDKRYMNLEDEFVYCQSLLNCVEVVINLIALYLHHVGNRAAIPLAYTVTVMTFWKTVLYFFMFYAGGPAVRAGNTLLEELLVVDLANGIWLLVPAVVMVALWPRLVAAVGQGGRSSRKLD